MSIQPELSPRRLKKLLKQYVRTLKSDPSNLVVRLKVAFVLKELGRIDEAIEIYQTVARAFAEEGRLVQAIAVCKGILEIDAAHRETQEMLAELVERQRPVRRTPAVRMQQVDGRWIAVPVPGPTLWSEMPSDAHALQSVTPTVEGGAEAAPEASPEAGLEVGTVPPPSGSFELGPPPSWSDEFSRTVGSPPEAAAGVSGSFPPDVFGSGPVPPEFGPESFPPGAFPATDSSLIPPGFAPPGEPVRSPRQSGMRQLPLVAQPFAGPPELEPNVDDLPPAPGQLDFPAETKAKARGAMLLDLPATAVGSTYEPSRAAEEDATRAASPSTLRKQVLREASDVDADALGALPQADDTTQPRQKRTSSTPGVDPPGADTDRQVPAIGAEDELEGPRTVRRRSRSRSRSRVAAAGAGSGSETSGTRAAGPGGAGADEGAGDEAVLRTLEELPKLPPATTKAAQVDIPLISDLPREALVELLSKMPVRHHVPGSVIVREGETGETFYVVAVGSVRVLKRRPDGQDAEVARLGPGSFFGEFALLGDQRRHASVIAIDEVELFEISRKTMAELAASHPEVLQTLRRFYRERLLATLLQTSPLFQPLTEVERARLVTRLCTRRFLQGQAIVEEGKATDGLYLILTGGVVVSAHGAGAEVELGRLGEGSYFGEMSLLRGGLASATVRAAALTEVVQLPAKEFYQVMAAHPVVWQEIRREAARREAANAALLTGRAELA